MKKVLALVLVAVMAFGMASVGFAATNSTLSKITGFWADNISYGYGAEYKETISIGTSYLQQRDAAGNPLYLDANGKETTTVTNKPLLYTNRYNDKGYWFYRDTMVLSGKLALGNVNTATNTVTYDRDLVPSEEETDYINLFVGMFTWETPSGWDIADWYVPFYSWLVYGTVAVDPATGLLLTDARTGDYLYESGSYNIAPNYFELVSGADIRNSKIAVRTAVSAGSKAIDDVSINTKDGCIEINYAEELIATSGLDFDFKVYLTIDGKRFNDQGLTFIGTLANPIQEVDADDDYVDLSDGTVAEALDFVPKIEVDLGNGVSIFTKFFKTKKYYGTASRDADEYDDAVFAKYLDVDNVVHLKTVGLNSTGDIVKLSTDYNDYFVYDVNMNYLGQSNTMLPYSTKYYLANKKLDITSDDAVIDETGDAPTGDALNPNTGGDDLPSSNPNGNPSTGR